MRSSNAQREVENGKKDGRESQATAAVIRQLALSALLLAPSVALLVELIVFLLGLSLLLIRFTTSLLPSGCATKRCHH